MHAFNFSVTPPGRKEHADVWKNIASVYFCTTCTPSPASRTPEEEKVTQTPDVLAPSSPAVCDDLVYTETTRERRDGFDLHEDMCDDAKLRAFIGTHRESIDLNECEVITTTRYVFRRRAQTEALTQPSAFRL